MASRLVKAAASSSSPASAASSSKRLWILRHGQATHNPRAEAARHNGCSYEEFMELMRQDDSLDSELTEMGREQAKAVYSQNCAKFKTGQKIDLVVSSSLSRSLQTADLACPFVENRVAIEDFREINGWLLNAQRRPRSELQSTRFPHWNFDALSTEQDELWTPELESQADCRERGYQGFCWLLQRPETNIFLVCHGGILRFTMNDHELVQMVDGRTSNNNNNDEKAVDARFGNCELRRYEIKWGTEEEEGLSDTNRRRKIVLTEVDQD